MLSPDLKFYTNGRYDYFMVGDAPIGRWRLCSFEEVSHLTKFDYYVRDDLVASVMDNKTLLNIKSTPDDITYEWQLGFWTVMKKCNEMYADRGYDVVVRHLGNYPQTITFPEETLHIPFQVVWGDTDYVIMAQNDEDAFALNLLL